MRFNSIKALVEADLLQANRKSITGESSKKMQKKNIYGRVLLQNLLMIGLFAFIFGSLIFTLPLAHFPGVFTETIGIMLAFALLQVFQLIYGMFYDDSQLSTYLSLPFSMGELFTSKIVAILLTTIAYFMTPLILITLLGWQTGHSYLMTLLIALFSTFLLIAAVIMGTLLAFHLLHQWHVFRKNKRFFIIGIYLVLFGVLITNMYSAGYDSGLGMEIVDSSVNPILVGFHEIFITGQRLDGWLKVALWLAAVIGMSLTVFKWVIPELYFGQDEPKKKKTSTQTKTSSLTSTSKMKVLIQYQIKQLADTTLILQMLFSKIYFPFIIIAPFIIGESSLDLSILSTIPHLWAVYMIVGLAIGHMMSNESSISGVIISFDKENYHYMKSLPLSFRGYLKFKFYFAFVAEWVMSAIVIVGLAIYLGLDFVPLLFVLSGYSIGTYAMTLYYFMRDYRLLDLTWSNFSELMQRGVSQIARVLMQFVTILIGVLLLGGFIFWFVVVLPESTRFILSFGIVFLFLLAPFAIHRYAEKKFWSQFNL